MLENTTGHEARAHDRQIREMFAGIASVYDRMNGLLSLGLDARWRHNLVREIDPTAVDLLDVCCGTGELILGAREAGRGRHWYASDFCEPMLRAGARDHGLGEKAELSVADTQQLPFGDASFDAVMVAFGLRNLGDLSQGLREIHRVLRPGGQLLVLEFFRARRRGPARVLNFYLSRGVPLLGRWFGGDTGAYRYLPVSMGRFVTQAEFCSLAEAAGFAARASCKSQSLGVAQLILLRKA
jgi:demethylmenaquinone methyltransferase/2-methoxy-6-polyprenyl-1,4-benzoquinol methylase